MLTAQISVISPWLLVDSIMHNASVVHINQQFKQNGEKNTPLLHKEHTRWNMYVKQKIRKEISIQHSNYLFNQISLQMQ